MRKILSLIVVALAFASLAQGASLTKANVLALQKNWARTIDTLNDAMTMGKADIAANRTRAAAITDIHGAGFSIANAELRDSVNVRLVTVARPFVENSMRSLANVFRDPDLRPVGAGGATYSNLGAFCYGEFAATDRLAPEVALLWRAIFGNGSLPAKICAPPVATSYGTVHMVSTSVATLTTAATRFDEGLYSGGLLEAYVDTTILTAAAAPDTETITGVDVNGSPWIGTVILTNSASPGTAFNVTATIAGTFPDSIISITPTHGASGRYTLRVRREYTYTQ